MERMSKRIYRTIDEAECEVNQGNAILAAYSLLYDYQFKYYNHLQSIWLDYYLSLASVEEGDKAMASELAKWEPEGLAPSVEEDTRKRIGVLHMKYAIMGSVRFRRQDILPGVDMLELWEVQKYLAQHKDDDEESRLNYVEFKDMYDSTYFKILLTKGPNAETKSSTIAIRPKLFRHLLVMRDISHCI
jgi:hypothetical protein